MKRKFLEDLGLEADVVEKIMAEAGKDTTSLKAKVDDLTEQVNVKDTTIAEKNKKIAELEKVDVEAIKQEQFDVVIITLAPKPSATFFILSSSVAI